MKGGNPSTCLKRSNLGRAEQMSCGSWAFCPGGGTRAGGVAREDAVDKCCWSSCRIAKWVGWLRKHGMLLATTLDIFQSLQNRK